MCKIGSEELFHGYERDLHRSRPASHFLLMNLSHLLKSFFSPLCSDLHPHLHDLYKGCFITSYFQPTPVWQLSRCLDAAFAHVKYPQLITCLLRKRCDFATRGEVVFNPDGERGIRPRSPYVVPQFLELLLEGLAQIKADNEDITCVCISHWENFINCLSSTDDLRLGNQLRVVDGHLPYGDRSGNSGNSAGCALYVRSVDMLF